MVASIEEPQTVAPVEQEWSLGYSMVSGSVPLTRIHARRTLTLWQWAGDVEDAVLILSELVANAVRYAGEPGALAGVRLAMLEDGTLLIDVSDPMPAFPGFGSIVAPSPTEVSGRGICLARALGARVGWFLRADGGGKTVRAELPPPDGAVNRCTNWRRVPLDLAREAREQSAAPHIDRSVQCQLSAHDDGDHFGLLADVGMCGTALWLRWHGTDEARLAVLPDCPVTAPGPAGEGCCLFADHTMQHTWEDALEEVSCTS
ncbi:ATP-binding protein [Streptomyces sp. NPDC057430]|uniref:ATP-binding protein n=1 Tax=Streptomyces sp. NPDC057430 TaxID=3346131 RepID=UPI00368806EF